MSDGTKTDTYRVESDIITGTQDLNQPPYLPGSPEHLVSLRKDKKLPVTGSVNPFVNPVASFSPATAPPAAAVPAAAVPAAAVPAAAVQPAATVQSAALPASAVPRIANVLNGTYAYGAANEKPVHFRLTLTGMTATNTTFTGIIEEAYSGFGIPANDGHLYADVGGSVLTVGGKTMVRFQKRFRFFAQDDVTFQCEMDPATGIISGAWGTTAGVFHGNVTLQPQK